MKPLSTATTPDADMVEDGLPVRVERDRTLRVKITDTCGMACTFCHNEGTPVVADNVGAAPGAMTGQGRSGRVSIYLADNGARFLPATVMPDRDFIEVLVSLRDELDLDEIHLTGGEPSLHPRLPEVIGVCAEAGFRVCMTSNGENVAQVIAECARAGLDRVNFSIFGTTAGELAQVQHEKFADARRAARKVQALRDAVHATLECGLGVSANLVVPHYSHADRVRRLVGEYAPELSVRLLNSLDAGAESVDAIERILRELDAVPVAHRVSAGVSGWRTSYRLPGGRELWFKRIRPLRLPQTCLGCRFNNGTDCHEGYYGLRLYRDRAGGFHVGVCIQRMDLCLPIGEFLGSGLAREIIELREHEYLRLSP